MCVVGMQWGIKTTRIVGEGQERRKGFWLMDGWRGQCWYPSRFSASDALLAACFMLAFTFGLLFNSEDGVDMLL